MCDCTVAASKANRRSVCEAILLGGNLLYSSSRTQRTIALSEAELYAATSARHDFDSVLGIHVSIVRVNRFCED